MTLQGKVEAELLAKTMTLPWFVDASAKHDMKHGIAWLGLRQCPCSGSVLLLDRDSINWWIIGYPNSCRTIYGQTQLRSKQIRASLDTWSSCAGELPLPQFSSQDDGDPRTHKIDIGIRGNARPLAGSINNDDSCSCLIHATLLWSPNFLWRVEFPHSQNPRNFIPRNCFYWTVVKGCIHYTESSGEAICKWKNHHVSDDFHRVNRRTPFLHEFSGSSNLVHHLPLFQNPTCKAFAWPGLNKSTASIEWSQQQ